MPGDEGRDWEKVLELLLGQKIPLCIQEVKVTTRETQKDDTLQQKKLIKPRFKDKYVHFTHIIYRDCKYCNK